MFCAYPRDTCRRPSFFPTIWEWAKRWRAAEAEHAALLAEVRAALPDDAETVMREAFAQIERKHEARVRVLLGRIVRVESAD